MYILTQYKYSVYTQCTKLLAIKNIYSYKLGGKKLEESRSNN